MFDQKGDLALAAERMVRDYNVWLKNHPLKPEELSPRYYEDAEKILFYHSDHWASNFSKHPVPLSAICGEWDGNAATSENLFQASKYLRNNHSYAYRIATAPTARESAKLGRDRAVAGREPDWDNLSLGVMVHVLLAKVSAHPEIASALKQTGDHVLIENTAHANYDDYIWGCGKRGDGKNYLGIAWMVVRDFLSH